MAAACRHVELAARAVEMIDKGRSDACRRLQYQLVPDLAVSEAEANLRAIPGMLAICREKGHL